MKLFIGEDSQSGRLIKALCSAEYDVLTVQEVKMNGSSDEEVLAFARRNNRAVLAKNCDDFRALHAARKVPHNGIFLVFGNRYSTKNMTRRDVITALNNLRAASFAMEDQLVALNQWIY